MTFEELKGLAFGRITIEELSQGLVQKLGEASITEATKIVDATKILLQSAITSGDAALKAEIDTINGIISGSNGNSIQEKITALDGRVTALETRMTAAEGGITNVEADLSAHKQSYDAKVNLLEVEDKRLSGEIKKLMSTVSGKTNDTQVFATMQDFTVYDTAQKQADALKKGDMAYVISVKKSYIYNPTDSARATQESPTPPKGWMFFDEITNDFDLTAYAKKTEVTDEIVVAKAALEAADTVLDGKIEVNKTAIETEATRAKGEETKIRTEFAAADVKGLKDAKIYTDEEIVKVNTAAGELAGKVTALEGKVDVAKVSEAIETAISPVRTKATANESAIAILNGNDTQEGSVDFKIKAVKTALELIDTGLRADITQAQTDILENAIEIAALEARKFILTRSQDLVVSVGNQKEYTLNTLASTPANALVDVHVNSVLMHPSEFTIVREENKITFKNQHAVGKNIEVVYTYNTIASK